MVAKGHRQLSQYLSSTEGLKVNLILKDLDKEQIDVYLRLKISGIGIVIANPDGFIPSQKITLRRGSLVTLSGSQLEEYFNPANLQAQGVDQSFLYQGGSLPQGSYRIEVTAYEVDRNRQVSNRGEVNTFVFLADPPLLISPKGTLMATYPQQVMFQWQLPGLPFMDPRAKAISYTLRLAKVGGAVTPANALNRIDSIVVIKSISSTSYLLTSEAGLLLEEGEQYVWEIEIDNPDYKGYYRNGGLSEPAVFTYAARPCDHPKSLSSSILLAGYTLKWTAVPEAVDYEVEYARIDRLVEAWERVNTQMTAIDLPLGKDLQYKARVKTVCRGGKLSQPGEEIYLINPVFYRYCEGDCDPPAPNPLLDRVLNPFSNPISIGSDGRPQTVKSLEEMLEDLKKLPLPDCGIAFTEGVDCEPTEIIEYDGSEQLSIAPGDILAINGFKVLVTEGGPNGKGLLYYNAFGGSIVPVNFMGVQAFKAKNGTKGGCVYAGEMPVEGSDNSVLDRDVQSRVAALLAKINDPGSYAGSFQEAIEEAKRLAQEIMSKIAAGQQPTAEDLGKFKTVCKAIDEGIKIWKEDAQKVVGNDPDLHRDVLYKLDEISREYKALADCAANQTVSGGGGNAVLRIPLLACNFDKAKPLGDSLKKVSDLLETYKLTAEAASWCNILKDRTPLTGGFDFILPDGRLITLTSNDQIGIFSKNYPCLTEHALPGFYSASSQLKWTARLVCSGTESFTGYYNHDAWAAGLALKDIQYTGSFKTPTQGQPIDAYAIKMGPSGADIYRVKYTPGQIIPGQVATSINIDETTKQSLGICYFSGAVNGPKDLAGEAGRKKLQIALAKYELADVGINIRGKDGKDYYVTREEIYGPEVAQKPHKATLITINESADGSVDINPEFKQAPGCPTCSGKAKEVFNQALNQAKAENGGKLTLNSTPVKGTTILNGLTNAGGGIQYETMDLADWLSSIAKAYNAVIEHTKVPEEVWQQGKPFPIKDNTAVISGALDGVRDELAGKADLVGMVLTVVSNPKETASQLTKFVTDLDWGKAGETLVTMGEAVVGFDRKEYDRGGEFTRHAVGKVGGTLITSAMTGGLLSVLSDAPDLLKKKTDDLLEALTRFTSRLKDGSLTDALKKDLTDQNFFKALDADLDLVENWEILQRNNRTVLKLSKEALDALKKLRSNPKIIALKIDDDILGKMKSYEIGVNSTSFAKICNDVDDILTNALPAANKINGLDKLLGSAGLGNASRFTRRHADFGIEKIKQNGNFLKNADEIKFEEFSSYDGVANAVADMDFFKDGKRYVAEFKAGDNVISSNFSSQCLNFMQRVEDLKNFKSFRREGVPLSKQSVITDWSNNGVLDNGKVQSLIKNFGKGYDFEMNTIKDYLQSNDDWFDSIFNSNF